MTQQSNTPARIIRLPEVRYRTGRSRSTIYRDIAAGRFPKPIKTGQASIGWLDSDVSDWIAERVAESRGVKSAKD